MNSLDKQLFDAIYAADEDGILKSISQGADVNAIDDAEETPLVAVIGSFESTQRIRIIKMLLEHGADPDYRGIQNCGVLFEAVLARDADSLQLLLANGANPNFLMGSDESLYDYAEFDYRFMVFDLKLLMEPTKVDMLNEDTWLEFLFRCAECRDVERPEYLRTLRYFGAKRSGE